MKSRTQRRRLPDHVAAAMTAVLGYLWQDEVRDYLTSSPSEQEGHIFIEMLTVRQWLTAARQSKKVRNGQ